MNSLSLRVIIVSFAFFSCGKAGDGSSVTAPDVETIGTAIVSRRGDSVILDGFTESPRGEYVVPDEITEIGKRAFYDSDVTGITFPSSLERIGEFAFAHCGSLVEITLPDSLTELEPYAFADCTGLRQMTAGSGLALIGEYAFISCINLRQFTLSSTTPPRLLEFEEYGTMGVFAFVHEDMSITVPAGTSATYKAADGWSAYAGRIRE